MWKEFLNVGLISRVRRNHALEHATLHVLKDKNPDLKLIGYSDFGGFWILGNVDTQELQQCVDEAIDRLRKGETKLAVHDHCGSNFAISGLVAGTVSWLAMLVAGRDFKKRVDQWPLVIALTTLALVFAYPLGPIAQQYLTTDASPGKLRILGIMIYETPRQIPVHRVLTRG